jgi:hypothetical protein
MAYLYLRYLRDSGSAARFSGRWAGCAISPGAHSVAAVVLALLTLCLFAPFRGLAANDGREEMQAGVVPYVTYQGEKDGARLYVVHYFTPRSVNSILISSTRPDVLERLKHPDAVRRAETNDQEYFGEHGAVLRLFRGKRAGTTDSTDIVAYRATFHRHRVRVEPRQPFAYLIYDGHTFHGPHVLRVAWTPTFRAVHLGHTRGNYVPDNGPLVTYSPRQIREMATFDPVLLLHSGDIFLSIYDWKAAYRETIHAFQAILPSTPLLIAASNHDQGWPASEHGFPEAGNFFAHFLTYPYRLSSLNYMVDYGGYRFLMMNYVDYRHRPEALERTVEKWVTASPHPVVIVWGGSYYTEKLIPLVRRFPKVRLLLGGDGGAYRKVGLAHGAYLIHNNHLLISLLFTPEAIIADVRDDDGAMRDRQPIAVVPPPG